MKSFVRPGPATVFSSRVASPSNRLLVSPSFSEANVDCEISCLQIFSQKSAQNNFVWPAEIMMTSSVEKVVIFTVFSFFPLKPGCSCSIPQIDGTRKSSLISTERKHLFAMSTCMDWLSAELHISISL